MEMSKALEQLTSLFFRKERELEEINDMLGNLEQFPHLAPEQLREQRALADITREDIRALGAVVLELTKEE